MKKKTRWQREQESRKKFKNSQVIIWLAVAIFFVLIIGVIWRVYGAFNNSTWDGRNRFNLVLNVSPISLASFDPSNQTFSFLVIPDGTYVEVADGYGPHRVEKIYPLGELEGRGAELLTKSLATYFGLPVDGWLMGDKRWEGRDEIKPIFLSLLWTAIKDKSRTNLSRWDLIRLMIAINQTRSHKIEVVDLGETTAAEEFDLADGTKAKKIDTQRLNRIISNLFLDYQIRQEDLAIAIVNASHQSGLAAIGAKLITNIGGRLVEVGDWQEKFEECQIKTIPTVRKTYTVQKLAKVFNCQVKGDLENNLRWDVLVILTKENFF